MKKILLILTLFLAVQTYGQDYNYIFKVQDVNDLAKAKEITDPLRNLFKCYPTFNDSLDVFEFMTTENVTKGALVSLLIQKGYTLQSFNKNMKPEIIKEEEK